MVPRKSAATLLIVFLGSCLLPPAFAADWPMWRYDAGRTAVSPETLPAELHLQWVRRLAPPSPAWPASQTKLQFDASYEPVVLGKRLFVSSMVSDRVTAYETETGKELWRFYTDGPVRFAPVAWKGKVAFASDDGCLYCVDAASGKLVWRMRGGPSARRVLGNDRLISTWPARGAPVLSEGVIHFAAGIWPFMGTFIHAVDAETGRVVWTNSGSGSIYMLQQHSSPAFAGVAPQGYMAVAGDTLLVSGGRTVPAAYDRTTGAFRYFHVSSRAIGKDAGGYEVVAVRDAFLNGGALYRLKDGDELARTGALLPADGRLIGFDGGKIVGYDDRPAAGSKGKKGVQSLSSPAWEGEPDVALRRLVIKAGSRLYAEGPDGLIAALDLPVQDERVRVSWKGNVEGDVWTMLAADGKLFVVTRDGLLYCFGSRQGVAVTHRDDRSPLPVTSDRWAAEVESLLDETDAARGYALVLGFGTGRLIQELLRRSGLHVIAVDPSAEKVASLRRKMDAAGVYGRRVAVHVGDPATFPFPPYLASLVASEDLAAAGFAKGAGFVRSVFRTLRPYGGVAWLPVPKSRETDVKTWVREAGLAGAAVGTAANGLLLTRKGALRGSADWTHQYADVANTVVSQEAAVRTPLGLLWFGGPANDPVLPRHGHGPSPHVVDGRLFIEGRNMLRAVDVYTGRLLWQQTIEDLGTYYDNTAHQPGANEIGSNYVSVSDGIYVAYGRKCVRLDPETGEEKDNFALPRQDGLAEAQWGYIGVYKDLLIATAMPIGIELVRDKKDKKDPIKGKTVRENAPYGAGSRWLIVMDRDDAGKKALWTRQAEANFRHNAIVAGAGKVFCIDGLSEARLKALRFRGLEAKAEPTLYALDARTGRVLWKTDKDVKGTWLGYSEKHDVLLVAGSRGRDRALDETKDGLAAYRGRDGKVLWTSGEDYEGPCMIHGARVIAQGKAFNLLTGKLLQRKHPLTGETVAWRYRRNYGCNTAIASRNLILFRSAAAGYYDLEHDGGTGNMGGFKSGCTSNLIPACGVLSAPDYTRTCTCSYQNQCSLAFIHDPDAEVWTFSSAGSGKEPIRRVGLNFGAPGDRLSAAGTLWLDWPSVGGSSPDPSVKVRPAEPKRFRRHMSAIEDGKLKWVAASGLEGVESMTVRLAGKGAAARPATVRLHFAEPEADAKPGDRVFTVNLQGKDVLKDFDIVKAAGGPRRTVVREFRPVMVTEHLELGFSAKTGKPLICGIEIMAR
jgi:outer membrane protein assembly factor BamB